MNDDFLAFIVVFLVSLTPLLTVLSIFLSRGVRQDLNRLGDILEDLFARAIIEAAEIESSELVEVDEIGKTLKTFEGTGGLSEPPKRNDGVFVEFTSELAAQVKPAAKVSKAEEVKAKIKARKAKTRPAKSKTKTRKAK